ncbi:MAG: hypothetical protein DI587_31340 [Variovorax paradoxus]|nr:MAG: hypothetical protein DI583_31340 [Variovorax paradoxus]PZQ03155.1 MAG: hypothetical protein DI587_31340 [Variovorax paradoxus]
MNKPNTPSENFEPVADMPHLHGCVVHTSSVTFSVHPTPVTPAHRLLSVLTARVVAGKLEMKFSPARLPDRNTQFAARMRRQRLQR